MQVRVTGRTIPLSRVIRVVILCLALATGTAACGSSSGSSSAAPSKADLSAVNAQLAKYTPLPVFKAPGPPINARKIMHGKTILGIPTISSNPFTTDYEAAESALAKKIGFKFIRWNNGGTVAEWANGINYGIAHHVSLIALDGGSEPKLLGPEIKKAEAAGITVVDTHETDVTQGKSPYVNFTIPAPYTLAGQLMADYAIKATNGHVHALIITSTDVIGSPPFVASIKATFKKYCPGCTYTVTNVPVANWASGIGPAVTGAIRSNPNLNFVLPIYDPETEFVVPALRTTGNVGKIKIATYAGTPFVLQDVKNGTAQFDVAENLTWVGYSMLDDEMRLIGHLKPVFPEYLAIRAVSAANIGNPSDVTALYGTSVGKGWLKLWGLS